MRTPVRQTGRSIRLARFPGSPAVANGVVYIGSDDFNVYAIDTVTQTNVPGWPFLTGAAVDSSPAYANGIVYVGSNDGKIYAIYAGNGTQYWNYTTQAVAVRNWIYSSPSVVHGVVYIGGGEGNTNLYAIGNQTGLTQIPTAAFTSNVRNGTAPLAVQFTDQSTGTPPLTYAWDFTNDGTVDNITASPVFTYNTVGVFTVNLTVSNSAGSNSSVKTAWINVTAAPLTNATTTTGVVPAWCWFLSEDGQRKHLESD